MDSLLLGLGWIVLGIIGLAALRAALRLRRRIADGWARTKAAIVRTEIVSSRYWVARPVVIYEYDAGTHHFLGQLRPWGWCWGPRAQAEASAARYTPGMMFSIYVNPDDHQQSLLRPWPSTWACALVLLITIFAFVFGLSLIASAIASSWG